MVKSTLLTISLLLSCSLLGGAKAADTGIHPVWITAPTLSPGTQGTATLEVDTAGTTDTVVNLTSSDPTQISVPSTVTVPAGDTQVPFTVTAAATATSGATVTGSANSAEAFGKVVVAD